MLYLLQNLLQLGIFRKTSIAGQFRLDWLRSSYRTFEWGYSVDFLRIEGYQPGKLCSWIVCYAWKKFQRLVLAISACFSSTFFYRYKNKVIWYNSHPVCCTRSEHLVLANVESWDLHASWRVYPRTGVLTFLTAQLLLQIFIYFRHSVRFKGIWKRPRGLWCWRSSCFWIRHPEWWWWWWWTTYSTNGSWQQRIKSHHPWKRHCS